VWTYTSSGSGWGGVNFLYSNSYDAVFWISYLNSVGNIHVLAIAEQGLHSLKASFVSHSAPPVGRLVVGKELGGDTAGQRDIP